MTRDQFNFIRSITNHWFIRHLFSKDVLDFIACQFALESNFGQSRLALVQHNYCGMKYPFKRVFYGFTGEKYKAFNFAFYSSLDACIIDYCSWVFYNRPYQNQICDLDAFKIFLRNAGYCPEKDYLDKINLIFNQLKSYTNGN